MELTKNLKLKKPAQEDFYNVDDFNANADILDDEIQGVKDGYVPVKGDYIKDLSVDGDTVTYTKGNDATGLFKTKTYSNLSEFENDEGFITKDDTCAGATNDGNGRNIVSTYATKAENSATLASAKDYTDQEKANYLPLTGGKMSGYIYKNVDNDAMMVMGGSDVGNGASLCLQGKSHTSKGGFFIRANDGATSIDFKGTPNGDLVWHGKNIVRSINGVDADINGNVSISALTYTGEVSLLASRASNGTWTIGNVIVDKPLFIQYYGNANANKNAYCNIFTLSGGIGGSSGTGYFTLGPYGNCGGLVVIPNDSTVVIKCDGLGDDDILYAYQ